jgi:endonuclease/exonuclease/phosphatase family metal-dependent hydrolase
MSLFSKRNFLLIAIATGLGFASQYYTIGGWQHLHLVPRKSPAASNNNAVLPASELNFPMNWETPGKLISSGRSLINIPSDPSIPSSSGDTSLRKENRGKWVAPSPNSSSLAPPKSAAPTLRVATFNLQSFGDSKASKLAVLEIIARIVRHFDVIALQDISSRQRDTLPRLIDRINQSDRKYDYCIGPRVGSPQQAMHYAFIFDSERIETDRYQLYTVEDPSDQLEYDPLVGWFRSRMVEPSKAMTFTLVNVRIDPAHREREIRILPELIKSIRQDGRGEDDILLAGDFGCADNQMGVLRDAGMAFALEGVPTTISGDEMLDNILFPAKPTDEFTGRAGTVDFLRKFNLTPDQAFQVSNHMPVWCEFFAEEGGIPGYR